VSTHCVLLQYRTLIGCVNPKFRTKFGERSLPPRSGAQTAPIPITPATSAPYIGLWTRGTVDVTIYSERLEEWSNLL
jgi:hypothetical protein